MTDSNQIFDSICKVLTQYVPDGTELKPETRIVADLEIDSVNVFDLIMEVEDEHDIIISMELISATHTIGELSEVVEGLVRANHNA